MEWYSNLKSEFKKHKSALLTKGSFIQNFSFSFTGSTIVILSQIIFAPILSRIYSPEAYGNFSFFNALAANLALMATLRLEGAIVLEKNEEDFHKLIKTVCSLALLFSCIIFIITLFIGKSILIWFKVESIKKWIYLLGPYILLTALVQITGNWTVRKKAFKEALFFTTPIVIGTKLFNVLYGLLSKGALYGLILVETVQKFFIVLFRLRFIIKEIAVFIPSFRSNNFKAVIKRYKQFPLYDLPGNWLSLFSLQLPIFMLSSNFGSSVIGQFGFAISLLEMPMRLLGYSIQPVFLQKVTEVHHNNSGDLPRISFELFKKLLLLGILPFSVITVFGSELFQIAFGKQWALAGAFTSYLSYFYLFRLISEPMDCILIVFQKQKVLFIFQLALLVSRLSILLIGALLLKSVVFSVLGYGAVSGLLYMILNLIIMKKSGVKISNVIKYLVPSIVITLSVLFLIKVLVFKHF